MGRFASMVLCCLLLTGLGMAQSTDYHRNNIVFGVGGAIPTGTSSNYLSPAPMINLGYGYRFNRLFQADAGLEIAFGAAHANLVSEFTDVGVVPGTDHEYMIPLGGRVYIPQPLSRIEVSVGGGAAYLHYSESISSNYSTYY